MTEQAYRRWLRVSGLMLLAQLALFTPFACSSAAKPAVVTVADVVNEVARKGDATYGVSVQQCNEAEKHAAEMQDLDLAKQTVARIREQCDKAFRVFERVRATIASLDAAVADAEAGKLTAKDLADLALEARRRVEEAVATARQVHTFLEAVQ
jgi:hypothetical protein